MAEKPTGIVLLTGLLILTGLAYLSDVLSAQKATDAVRSLMIGITTLVLAWGILKGRAWAWWLVLATASITFVIGLINFYLHFLAQFLLAPLGIFIMSRSFVETVGYGLIAAPATVSYFLRPEVREYFNVENSLITQIVRSFKPEL